MEILNSVDPAFVLSGLVVGLLVGMTGVGGGSLMTPLLILVFGVHPATAVGTDLLFAASTKTMGTIAHGASKTIRWRVVGLLASGSVPATLVSLTVLSRLNLDSEPARHAITAGLGAVLLLTSLFLFCAGPIRRRYSNYFNSLNGVTVSKLTVTLGLVMGVLVSFTSVGAGAIGVTVLFLLYPNMPSSSIVGSDIAHAVPLTLLAGMGHWLIGSLNITLLLPLLVGSLPGIGLGSYLAWCAPERVLRIVLALTLCSVGFKLVF
jgi:uncharacterized protein